MGRKRGESVVSERIFRLGLYKARQLESSNKLRGGWERVYVYIMPEEEHAGVNVVDEIVAGPVFVKGICQINTYFLE
jgi:hypothetical protein